VIPFKKLKIDDKNRTGIIKIIPKLHIMQQGKKIPDKTILLRTCHVLSYKLSQNKSVPLTVLQSGSKCSSRLGVTLLFRLFVPCHEPQSFF
jgi:hypothetical protein